LNTSPSILAYPIREACAVSGIGRTKIYDLIAKGRLDARQCGGRTLIPAESLRAFLDNLPAAPIRRKTGEVA
jgi:excisionase family DNA binding protein